MNKEKQAKQAIQELDVMIKKIEIVRDGMGDYHSVPYVTERIESLNKEIKILQKMKKDIKQQDTNKLEDTR